MFCLIDLLMGLQFKALVDFFAIFPEWFSCAVISPLIIYWGMVKTENLIDKPIVTVRRGGVLLAAVITINVILSIFTASFLPAKIDVLPFVAVMFTLSIVIIATRVNPLKILVGLNMAENALYPLFAESPLYLIPFMLALMIFVNIVGVFIIIESYHDYGALSIRKWRCTG